MDEGTNLKVRWNGRTENRPVGMDEGNVRADERLVCVVERLYLTVERLIREVKGLVQRSEGAALKVRSAIRKVKPFIHEVCAVQPLVSGLIRADDLFIRVHQSSPAFEIL